MLKSEDQLRNLYIKCVNDLADYEETIITQRKIYSSTQLSTFLYTILGSFLIYWNEHIPIPIKHRILSFVVLACGLSFYVALFNVNFFIQRKWQLGVSATIAEIKHALSAHNVKEIQWIHSYSADKATLDTILLATLSGLCCFTITNVFLIRAAAAPISIVVAALIFFVVKSHIDKVSKKRLESRPHYFEGEPDVSRLELAWAMQLKLIKRMTFVNESLNSIRKSLLLSFLIYPLALITDVFSKDVSVSIRHMVSYAYTSVLVFLVVIAAIWNYDINENQIEAKRIFAAGVDLERSFPVLPQIWENMAQFTSENYVVYHMNNLYIIPLVLSQIIGLVFLWPSPYSVYAKVVYSLILFGLTCFVVISIYRKSLVKPKAEQGSSSGV